MKQYSVSLDNSAKIITGLILLLTVSMLAFGAFKPALVLVIIVIICYGYQPRKYVLTKTHLTILRLFGAASIETEKISSVEQASHELVKGSIRAFGVGGLFGYFGEFINAKLGRMTWYATRRTNYVLIKTADHRKFVLTPDQPQQLVNELEQVLSIHRH
jgi:uncharacterized membrane protein